MYVCVRKPLSYYTLFAFKRKIEFQHKIIIRAFFYVVARNILLFGFVFLKFFFDRYRNVTLYNIVYATCAFSVFILSFFGGGVFKTKIKK